MLSKTVVLINLHCLSQPEISLNPRLQLTYNPRLQRFQVVVKSHPLGKNSSPQFNFVLLPSRFGKNHNRSLSYYGSWIRLLTLHFSNITFFSTQNSLLITSCLKAVKWRNVLELRWLLWRYAFQKKNRKSSKPCTYRETWWAECGTKIEKM